VRGLKPKSKPKNIFYFALDKPLARAVSFEKLAEKSARLIAMTMTFTPISTTRSYRRSCGDDRSHLLAGRVFRDVRSS